PLYRYQQYHALQPAVGRTKHAIEQRAGAQVRRRIESAADPRNASERQADRGFRIDPPARRTACHASWTVSRAVVDAARWPSAYQGVEGTARGPRGPNPRRS